MSRWEKTADYVVEQRGTLLLIGATDTGKTTFVQMVVNRGVDAGVKVAVIDADIGQSDIGPPGTVAMGIVCGRVAELTDIKPKHLYFVGTNSPEMVVTETVTAVRMMLDKARQESDLIVIDTTGLVCGWTGRVLKQCKIDVCSPDYLVVLQKKNELDHLVRGVNARVFELPAASGKAKKSFYQRRDSRKKRFAEFFSGGRTIEFGFDQIRFGYSYLGSGKLVPAGELQSLADGLDCDIVYGERIAEGLFVVMRGEWSRLCVEQLKRRANAGRIMVGREGDYQNLLVGIMDGAGHTIGIGVCEQIDFFAKKLQLFTIVDEQDVAVIKPGFLRVDRQGRELDRLKPGNL